MRICMLFAVLCFCHNTLRAQDTLPKLSVNNIHNSVIISWTNPFTNLTTINIQRSPDSTKNFVTIGTILDVKNKRNGYVDTKPPTTLLFYRVFVSFQGGSYLFTKSYKPYKDTAKISAIVKDVTIPVATWFIPSTRVYTGKDNNIIISLPDAEKKKYAIKFFEENGTPAFEIKKITEPYLTLEKVNFTHAGIFNFELYEDDSLIEKHKVYVPKDNKPFNINAEMEKSIH